MTQVSPTIMTITDIKMPKIAGTNMYSMNIRNVQLKDTFYVYGYSTSFDT